MLRRKVIVLALCIVLIFAMIASAELFKVELSLFERYVVSNLYPREHNFATLKIIREIQMILTATEEEYALAGLQDLPNGGVTAENWNAVKPKEIAFGDVAKELVVEALKKLDEQKKLTQLHFSLYEKFVIGEEVE